MKHFSFCRQMSNKERKRVKKISKFQNFYGNLTTTDFIYLLVLFGKCPVLESSAGDKDPKTGMQADKMPVVKTLPSW